MISDITDHIVFGELVKLYGFKRQFKDNCTTHLVVFDDKDLHKSKKLQYVKDFKKKPEIVCLDWLIECMETGKVPDSKKYEVSSTKES